MSRKLPIAVIVLLVMVAAGAWWLRPVGEHGDAASPPVAQGPVAAVVPAEEADPFDPFPEMGQSPAVPAGPPPKRVVHVPAGAAADDAVHFDWRELSAGTLLPTTVAMVAAALDGNLPASDLLISVQQNCRRMPRSEESIRRWSQRAAEWHRRTSGQRSSFYGLFDPRPTAEENEAEFRRWGAACDDLRQVWDDDISKELARLAAQGSVSARLLFAMFPPRAEAGGVVPFTELFAWEALARDYSWQNLSQGAPEGLLAFGQSYLHGLFTPRDFTLAAAFFKAAQDCSGAVLASGAIVTRFESAEAGDRRGPDAGELAEMLQQYEALIGYCR